ncbi:GPI transamidase component PIG-S-like [Elysia marginata]|uniref:GPI transamidase component PIG-S-like n=1 Tax=Elysia marginata TaxID=1093978 RepID=A0AAV4II10_9GAST|nr:GPI transamidase component PIG-S-like [Elysia marginata]
MSTSSVCPPLEKENDIEPIKEKNIQHTAALCFGLFFIVVGLPLWWKTTMVYRVSLPYSDIQHLSEKQIEYLTDVNVVWAAGEKKNNLDLSALATRLKKVLDDQRGFSTLLATYRVAVREGAVEETIAIQNARKVSDLSPLFSTSHLNSYTMVITSTTEVLVQPVIAPFNNIFLPYNGADAPALTDQIVQLLKDVMRSTSVVKMYDVARKQTAQRPDKDTMRSFRYHAGFDVTFTLMVPEPDEISVHWDIEAGVKDYLDPLFTSLEEYTKFTVTSQVLYFVSLGGKPKKGENFFYYEERDLPQVINPLESKLGSHASNNPGLNLIACIPTKNKSPLHIKDSTGSLLKSDAFLSPRWGGVMIYNLEKNKSNQTLETVQLDMHKLMEVFAAQIRLLLNIQAQISTSEAVVLTGGTSRLHQWEVAGWLRCRCVENLATSTSTLNSLAQLLEEIGNIVINDEIGKEVESAVASIKSSHNHLAYGNLREAFLASRDALRASELAFFHPSLLELLYFPEDQKFAIYIPLFLPISIPVVTSTVQAIKWFRKLRKAKED